MKATPISLVTGDAEDLPLNTYLKPTGTVPARYKSADTLSASVFQFGVATAIFTPSVGWFTAPDFNTGSPTQTGYDQGEVEVSITNAQAALLVPSVSYMLVVRWSPAANPTESKIIVRVPLTIETVQGP